VNRLREGAIVPLVWAALLAVQTAIIFAFPARLITHLLNAGMVVAMLLLGAALLGGARGRDETGAMRSLPDGSAATVALAAGVTALVLGVELGSWLMLVGAGMVALGAGGLIRELRAEHRGPR
jgi:hypothetical protein